MRKPPARGAFKIRGASNLILSLPQEALARGVVAYSSGNHAQGVALAARHVERGNHRDAGGCAALQDGGHARVRGGVAAYNRFTENREEIAGRFWRQAARP